MIYAAYCGSKKCGRRIVYVGMMTGRSMPCDPHLVVVAEHPQYVGKTLITPDGRTLKQATKADIGYVPHRATCLDNNHGAAGASSRDRAVPRKG